MLIVRMEAGATEDLRRLVRAGEIGGVILFPPEGADPGALGDQVAALRRSAERVGAEPPLVAIDQEGGEVERLPALAPDRSPAEIALAGERAARAEGRTTGRALGALGIDVDLAPVLDVPAIDGAFIASRTYSSDPQRVAALGTAFGSGLQQRGVAATAKHFPGLGLATENTDLAPSAIDASRAALDAGLEPFRAAIEAGFELVMVANATYPAFEPGSPGLAVAARDRGAAAPAARLSGRRDHRRPRRRRADRGGPQRGRGGRRRGPRRGRSAAPRAQRRRRRP